MKNEEDEDGMARDEHAEKDGTAADQPVVVTDKSKLEKKKEMKKTLYSATASEDGESGQGGCADRWMWWRVAAMSGVSNEKHNYQYKGQLHVDQ